jgi:hypothetical protein
MRGKMSEEVGRQTRRAPDGALSLLRCLSNSSVPDGVATWPARGIPGVDPRENLLVRGQPERSKATSRAVRESPTYHLSVSPMPLASLTSRYVVDVGAQWSH